MIMYYHKNSLILCNYLIILYNEKLNNLQNFSFECNNLKMKLLHMFVGIILNYNKNVLKLKSLINQKLYYQLCIL